MKEKTAFPKNNVFDWLPIQLLRLNEQHKNDDDYENPIIETEKDDLGHLVHPIEYLSARTEILLPKYIGLSKKTLRKIFLVMFYGSCLLTIVFGIVIYPLMWANSILESRFVNLAGPFVYFLIGQLIFLALSFLFIFLTLIFSFLAWITPARSSRNISRLADFFIWLSGIIGSFMISVMRWISIKISKHWKQKEIDILDEKRVNIISEFFDYLFLNRQSLLFWGSMLSHLFWLTMSISVLIILIIKMQGNLYDYCWKTSLGNKDQIEYFTKALGTPFEFLGVVPDSKDVHWLINNSEVSFTNVPKKNIDQSDQAARTTWSWFLLNIVLVYCIIPRFTLTYLYWILFRLSLRNFRPDLKDEYFAKLLALEENYITQTESCPIFDDEQIPSDAIKTTSKTVVELNAKDSFSQKSMIVDNINHINNIDNNFCNDNDSDKILNETGNTEGSTTISQAPSYSLQSTVPDFLVDCSLNGNSLVNAQKEQSQPDQNVKQSISFGETKKTQNVENQIKTDDQVIGSSNFSSNALSIYSISSNQDQVEMSQNDSLFLSSSNLEPLPKAKLQRYILVLGYDAVMPNSFWKEIFGDSSALICFGNIVETDISKRRFFNWFEKYSSCVEKCVVLTDYSLPPAKQFILFLQDDLLNQLNPISFFLILSCGEKLRKKFHNNIASISERTNDWKNIVSDLKKKNQANIQSVYFDHELNLLKAKVHLKQILNSDHPEQESLEELIHPDYSFQKMNQSFSLILEESTAIFKSGQLFSEENECERLKNFYEKLIRIYRDENDYLTAKSQLFFLTKPDAEESFITNTQKILSNIAPNVDLQYIKESVLPAASVYEKAQTFCARLSPKCALAMASVGATIPVAITLAPFVAGTASLVALTASLSSLLPSVALSGSAGAVIGSVLPQSFHLFKKKLKNEIKRLNPFSSKKSSEVPSDVSNQSAENNPQDDQNQSDNFLSEGILQENLLKINSFVCAATTWIVILELQMFPEEMIAEKMALILQPLELSSLDSINEIEAVLNNVKTNLIEIGREKQ